MEYYEISEPYYALIKAKCKQSAVREYIKIVSGDAKGFDSLMRKCVRISKQKAFVKFSQSTDENGKLIDADELLETVKNDKTEILLIDPSLL